MPLFIEHVHNDICVSFLSLCNRSWLMLWALSHFLSCVFDVMTFTVPFSLIEIRTNTQMHTTSHHFLKSLNLVSSWKDRWSAVGNGSFLPGLTLHTWAASHRALWAQLEGLAYYINKDQMMQVRERACIWVWPRLYPTPTGVTHGRSLKGYFTQNEKWHPLITHYYNSSIKP